MTIIDQLFTFFRAEEKYESPTYDIEFIEEKQYAHIETFVEIEGEKQIRCNLCGRLFAIQEMDNALDHVSDHNRHVGDSIDAIESVAHIDVEEIQKAEVER